MIDLDLLQYRDRLRTRADEKERISIFDIVRRKWVLAQPEEWIRQLLIRFLVEVKGYSPSRMGIEKKLLYNKITRRFDLLVYDTQMKPFILAECKAPKVKISSKAFDQIAQYNYIFHVPFLLVTNGLVTYCCHMNYDDKSYVFLTEIPGPSGY